MNRALVWLAMLSILLGPSLAAAQSIPLETYIYGAQPAPSPYSSGLRMPAIPGPSANSLTWIPANVLATLSDTQTLSNKTLVAPVMNGMTNNGFFTDLLHQPSPSAGGNVAVVIDSKNTSPTVNGYGMRYNWSSAFTGSGFEIGLGIVANLNNVTSISGNPAYLPMWFPTVCPDDASSDTYACATEIDIGYQGRDFGWVPSLASSAQWAAGLVLVPTCNGNLASGTCKSVAALFAGRPSLTAPFTQAYNVFLADYDPASGRSSIAPGGYGLYLNGDQTGGSSSNHPAAPIGAQGAFAHGIQLGGGTYDDGIALNAGTAALKAGGLIATAVAPTVSSGQIGFGGTTTDTSHCGSLAGAAGCIIVNVGGTTHYVPYF